MQCYFMIMLSLCTPTNEGSERRKAKERRESRLNLPSTHVGVFFFLLSVFSLTWCFCFSQLALHADRMVIFIVIIALNCVSTCERAVMLGATAVTHDGLEYQ